MSPILYWNEKISLHGAAVQVSCGVERLAPQVEKLLRIFARPTMSADSSMASGIIRPFDEGDVLRHVSSKARRLATADSGLEIYQDGERFWMVDERWGMAEMNLLRAQWRSWVLENSAMDAVQLAEGALLWPMAQVLRARKIHLAPAVSVIRDGWGILLVAPFSLEPELARMIKHGWRIIGQRWTALIEREGTIEMLYMPGNVEKAKSLSLRRRGTGSAIKWIDLEREYRGCGEKGALCHAVIMIEPGRRSSSNFNDLSVVEAQEALRRGWPNADVHPTARAGMLANKLGQICRCARVELSHDAADLMFMLEEAQAGEARARSRVSIMVSEFQRQTAA